MFVQICCERFPFSIFNCICLVFCFDQHFCRLSEGLSVGCLAPLGWRGENSHYLTKTFRFCVSRLLNHVCVSLKELKFTLAVTKMKGYFEAFFEERPPFKLSLIEINTDETVWSATIREGASVFILLLTCLWCYTGLKKIFILPFQIVALNCASKSGSHLISMFFFKINNRNASQFIGYFW